ncbi:SH2 domain-containing protein 4A isoform X2 [Hemicordylus capensis]|uniref:SH2 domain-containing protein 4A isoform X2 n=1 Tax=Hemicordylus capensis TaxID=884348 RepID=UPI0023024B35|nr:SH2 domain-containing protein 4A isoform X2 [Hemicordylus capensis]XP_053115615.1 SH2 domain-containing protein 4A isoform X2 [Hemicordylus capensis]
MLKQILSDMYVDPELLAELSEEQKQILFFKMRQEQIRKWKEREAATTSEMAPRKPALRKAHIKSVQWKLGADGDVWVWVMGEHSLDKPYDQLCGEILAERVKQQSLQDAEAVRSPVEVFTGSSATLSLHFPPELGSEIQRDCKNPVEWNTQKGVKKAQVAENARNQERIQPPVSKPRGVEQMLADSVSQSRKYGSQQRKEELMRTTMNEIRAQGEATPNLVYESMQKSDKEDPDWLESLRRSKAADERRSSLARHARDDYKRLSLQGAHKGKAAEVSKTSKTREQRQLVPPPLPPKPKHLFAGIANGKPDRLKRRQKIPYSTRGTLLRLIKVLKVLGLIPDFGEAVELFLERQCKGLFPVLLRRASFSGLRKSSFISGLALRNRQTG